MYSDPPGTAKPRVKLLRTWLRLSRPVRQFAPKIEFDPAKCPLDPAIAAHWGEHLILDDFVTALHRDGTISGLRHLVTHLHSPEALMQWDEVVRVYDTRKELHKLVKARLYLPDGTVREATKKSEVIAVPDARHGNRYGRSLQAWFSPLRPGVVLEVEEQFDSFRPDELGPFLWNQFYFTTRPPAMRRRCVVAIAEPFKLSYEVHHADLPPAERQHKNYRVYTWDLHDVDGVELDEWTPPFTDFVPWVDLATAPSWAPFARKLRKELEPAAADGNVRELARSIVDGKTSDLEKAAAAYQYTAHHVRYGRPPAEMLTRNIRSSSQVIEDLRGDCKDKSALLVQLLRSLDMDANIAVVLTADNGRTRLLPSTRFNHALVKLSLDDGAIWLDPASGPFSFGDLPPGDQDISALVFHHDGFYFDHIPPFDGTMPLEHRAIEAQLALDGSYRMRATIRYRGDIATRLRMTLGERTDEHRREALQLWFGNDYPGAVGTNFTYSEVNDLSDGMTYSCDGELERVARRLKNILLLQLPWANGVKMTGPMSALTRRQPLGLPSAHYCYEQHSIALPEKVAVYALPDPVVLRCEWGEYKCTMKVVEGRLNCERHFRLHGPMVPAAKFPEFREFWRQASWSDCSQMVLRIG